MAMIALRTLAVRASFALTALACGDRVVLVGDDAVCGDGVVSAGEACDDAAPLSTSCEARGYPGGTLACLGCSLDEIGCEHCGNGVCENDETSAGCPDDCGVVHVAASDYISCAVLADGSVRCWGSNWQCETGIGYQTDEPVVEPIVVVGIDRAVAVAMTTSSACALRDDGTIRCWGTGALGDGQIDDSCSPVDVVGIDDAVELDGGETHVCARVGDGTARCWGRNHDGQLGAGVEDSYSTLPFAVLGLTEVVGLGLGRDHSCAVLADGSASCWGSNQCGQLGIGSSVPEWENAPVPVTAVRRALAIDGMGAATCALLETGGVHCWGGLLTESCDSPDDFVVEDLGDAVQLSAGLRNLCVMRGDGTVSCVDFTYTSKPKPVDGIEGATQLAVGRDHACAVLSDRTMRCWGSNGYGQLGIGSSTTGAPKSGGSTPVEPVGL